jgi:hypothetical protein
VDRELIALRHGEAGGEPVIGMFMGGAGLADTMLYCRDKICSAFRSSTATSRDPSRRR